MMSVTLKQIFGEPIRNFFHLCTLISTSVNYGKQNYKGGLRERRAAKKKEHGTNCEKQLKENFGHSETLYACNTYQFTDYSRYAMTMFKEEDKRQYRDAHWQTDLQNAYELGKRLVEKAKGE